MKTRKLVRVSALLTAWFGLVAPVSAALTSIDLSSFVNADLRTYTNGSNYPVAPTTLTVGGIPFDVVPLPNSTNSLGIVQDPGTPGSAVLADIPTSVANPARVYTLINSGFGALGTNIATLEFVGAAGAFASFDLVEGTNIRDHFNGIFVNVVTDPAIETINFAGNVRLDRQTFVLPNEFATDTLTNIRFIGHGSGNPQGSAFLAAATVAPIPEPSEVILLLVGIAVLMLRANAGVRRSGGR